MSPALEDNTGNSKSCSAICMESSQCGSEGWGHQRCWFVQPGQPRGMGSTAEEGPCPFMHLNRSCEGFQTDSHPWVISLSWRGRPMGNGIYLSDAVSAASGWGLDLPLLQSLMKSVSGGNQIF